MNIVLSNRDRRRVTADFARLSPISENTKPSLRAAVAGIEAALVDLFDGNTWSPQETGGAGLVFPVDLKTLQRAHTTPETVKVCYVICEGNLAGAYIMHLDDAIGAYAHGSIAWAKGAFGTNRVAFVRSLCVSKEFRGFGIGRAMLCHARELAQRLGAGGIVGHLRVFPELDQRLEVAYSEAGFNARGETVTTKISRTEETGWTELLGSCREHPVDPTQLPTHQTVELKYVPVGSRLSLA